MGLVYCVWPVMIVHCCPARLLVYIIGILHGSSWIRVGLLCDSPWFDDDDNAAVAVDVADAVPDDDDNGHGGDHHCHPQVIHIT